MDVDLDITDVYVEEGNNNNLDAKEEEDNNIDVLCVQTFQNDKLCGVTFWASLRCGKAYGHNWYLSFFTRTKLLEKKIYTEKTRKLRQNTQKIASFFALLQQNTQ